MGAGHPLPIGTEWTDDTGSPTSLYTLGSCLPIDETSSRFTFVPNRKWQYPGKDRVVSTDYHVFTVYLLEGNTCTAFTDSNNFHVTPVWTADKDKESQRRTKARLKRRNLSATTPEDDDGEGSDSSNKQARLTLEAATFHRDIAPAMTSSQQLLSSISPPVSQPAAPMNLWGGGYYPTASPRRTPSPSTFPFLLSSLQSKSPWNYTPYMPPHQYGQLDMRNQMPSGTLSTSNTPPVWVAMPYSFGDPATSQIMAGLFPAVRQNASAIPDFSTDKSRET